MDATDGDDGKGELLEEKYCGRVEAGHVSCHEWLVHVKNGLKGRQQSLSNAKGQKVL